MREKLIQILDDRDKHWDLRECHARSILTNLRCDHCKHWKSETVGSGYFTVSFTECLHPSNRWPDRDCDGEEFLKPKPDFFCAHWKEK